MNQYDYLDPMYIAFRSCSFVVHSLMCFCTESRSAREAQQAYASQRDESFMSSIHVEPLPVQEEVGEEGDGSKKSDSVLYIQRVWENYNRHIFWFTLYQLVTLAIFGERAYCK